MQEQGERAGLELRRLLGLLRDAGEETSPVSPAGPRRRIPRKDVVLAAVVTVLAVVESFVAHAALSDAELTAVWPLVVLRTAVLVASSAEQVAIDGGNAYTEARQAEEVRAFWPGQPAPHVRLLPNTLPMAQLPSP